MRKLLLLALLLYDIVARGTHSNNYDYDDIDANKRHSLIDERRNWRKKALIKSLDSHKEWDRRRRDYEASRYLDEAESKSFNNIDKQRELDMSGRYRDRGPRHYGNLEKLSIQPALKSAETPHSSLFLDKDIERKSTGPMNCDRAHEKFESCFAGCASVTCDNPRDRLRPCYPFCEAGCVCAAPYVRDDRTHKCVLPEDCTKGLKGIPDLGDDT